MTMHKIKVSEATPLQLDWLVAKIEYPDLMWGQTIGIHHASRQIVIPEFPEPTAYYSPTSKWVLGGAIIERELIDIRYFGEVGWCADGNGVMRVPTIFGPTPLIAAMRCYVASKLGDEVEVLEELS
jgi:hypothetical protein